jgi:immune inhibitor A
MVIAGVATGSASGGAQALEHPVADSADLQETYINYVAPRVENAISKDVKVSKKTVAEAKAFDRKHAGGNPVTAKQLARGEQQALKTGKSPRQIKKAPATQEAKLLTILVEYNPEATYDWSGVMVPKTVFQSRDCVPAENVPSGPLHNQIQDPATFVETHDAPDNNSFWVGDPRRP